MNNQSNKDIHISSTTDYKYSKIFIRTPTETEYADYEDDQ